ncbi:MAG: LysM peptidoglycan-binding domain-containing protein, partial [Hymenobacter sp.]
TEDATEEEAEEIAAINELPTEVPGAPVLALPTAHPTQVPVYVPASRPVVVAPVAVRTYPAPRPAPLAPRPLPAVSSPWVGAGTYTVAPHETLYALARRVGVRPAELAAWNSLPPTAALQVGQLIRLSPPAQLVTARTGTATHTVATGDTLFNISQRYGCTVAELQASNGRSVPTLRVGETIRVPTH